MEPALGGFTVNKRGRKPSAKVEPSIHRLRNLIQDVAFLFLRTIRQTNPRSQILH
jgi:hypothetical protein